MLTPEMPHFQLYCGVFVVRLGLRVTQRMLMSRWCFCPRVNVLACAYVPVCVSQ